MPMLRTVKCDICGMDYTETQYGAGFPNWMNILGISLDGNEQVWLCPVHMAKVADYIDSMANPSISSKVPDREVK